MPRHDRNLANRPSPNARPTSARVLRAGWSRGPWQLRSTTCSGFGLVAALPRSGTLVLATGGIVRGPSASGGFGVGGSARLDPVCLLVEELGQQVVHRRRCVLHPVDPAECAKDESGVGKQDEARLMQGVDVGIDFAALF